MINNSNNNQELNQDQQNNTPTTPDAPTTPPNDAPTTPPNDAPTTPENDQDNFRTPISSPVNSGNHQPSSPITTYSFSNHQTSSSRSNNIDQYHISNAPARVRTNNRADNVQNRSSNLSFNLLQRVFSNSDIASNIYSNLNPGISSDGAVPLFYNMNSAAGSVRQRNQESIISSSSSNIFGEFAINNIVNITARDFIRNNNRDYFFGANQISELMRTNSDFRDNVGFLAIRNSISDTPINSRTEYFSRSRDVIVGLIARFPNSLNLTDGESNNTLLHSAVRAEDLNAVNAIIDSMNRYQNFQALDFRNNYGQTPLDIAAEIKNREILGAIKNIRESSQTNTSSSTRNKPIRRVSQRFKHSFVENSRNIAEMRLAFTGLAENNATNANNSNNENTNSELRNYWQNRSNQSLIDDVIDYEMVRFLGRANFAQQNLYTIINSHPIIADYAAFEAMVERMVADYIYDYRFNDPEIAQNNDANSQNQTLNRQNMSNFYERVLERHPNILNLNYNSRYNQTVLHFAAIFDNREAISAISSAMRQQQNFAITRMQNHRDSTPLDILNSSRSNANFADSIRNDIANSPANQNNENHQENSSRVPDQIFNIQIFGRNALINLSGPLNQILTRIIEPEAASILSAPAIHRETRQPLSGNTIQRTFNRDENTSYFPQPPVLNNSQTRINSEEAGSSSFALSPRLNNTRPRENNEEVGSSRNVRARNQNFTDSNNPEINTNNLPENSRNTPLEVMEPIVNTSLPARQNTTPDENRSDSESSDNERASSSISGASSSNLSSMNKKSDQQR